MLFDSRLALLGEFDIVGIIPIASPIRRSDLTIAPHGAPANRHNVPSGGFKRHSAIISCFLVKL